MNHVNVNCNGVLSLVAVIVGGVAFITGTVAFICTMFHDVITANARLNKKGENR